MQKYFRVMHLSEIPLGTIHSASPKLLLRCQICRRHQTGTAAGSIIRRAALIPILQTIKCYHPYILLVHVLWLQLLFILPTGFSVIASREDIWCACFVQHTSTKPIPRFCKRHVLVDYSALLGLFEMIWWICFKWARPAADLNLYYDHCAQTINIAGALFTCTTVTLAVKSWSMSTWEPKKVASICFASVIITYIQGFLVNDIGKFACTYRPITCVVYTLYMYYDLRFEHWNRIAPVAYVYLADYMYMVYLLTSLTLIISLYYIQTLQSAKFIILSSIITFIKLRWNWGPLCMAA